MKSISVVVLVVLSFILFFSFNAKEFLNTQGKPSEDIVNLSMNYKSLTRMTEKPVLIDRKLSALCRGVFFEDIQEAGQRTGPHAYTSIYIYMNDVAVRAFKKKPYRFPVGSVIVKDKSPEHYGYESAKQFQENPPAKDGVGGMIKRSTGYDSAHGDWEYFYFTNPSAIESGRIKTCVNCHSKTSKTDYVFGGWSEQVLNEDYF